MIHLDKHRKVQDFLNAVCAQIWNKNLHLQIRCELLNHLEDFVEEKVSDGLPVEDAVELAVLKLGSPLEIGTQFNRIHKPWFLQPLVLAVCSVFVICLGGLTYSQFLFWKAQGQSQEYQQKVNTKIDFFIEDQRVVSSDPFFTRFGRSKDAGEFLNSKIAWDYTAESPFVHEMNKWPEIVPSPELRAKLNGSWAKSWLDHVGDISSEKLGFSWMKDLESYDHWDLFAHGPLSGVVKYQRTDFNPFAMPIPDYTALRGLAKLRLMKGLLDKQPLQALREVRQFTKLILSQEIVIGDMTAIAILRAENEVYQLAVSRGLLKEKSWQPYSKDFLDKAQRALYAFIGIFDLNTDTKILRKVFLDTKSSAGICTALREGITRTLIGRTYMSGGLLFESDFEDKLKLLNEIIEKRGVDCRLPYAKAIWKNDDNFIRAVFSDSRNFSVTPTWIAYKYMWGRYIPFYRRAIGAELLAIAMPGTFVSKYENATQL